MMDEKRKGGWFILLVMLSLFVNGCSVVSQQKDPEVKYEVTGTATTVDITMENSSGGTSQFSDVAVPWSTYFTSKSGAFVYISAQNQASSGSVTVRIYKDGIVFKESTSSGAYVIATASGSL